MYKYDAYGKKYYETGPPLIDEPAYTARKLHDRTGPYYYRNRFYNPQLGRFLSQDPIGHLGGMNLYAYVLNDPVNFVDPLGLCEAGQKTASVAGFPWDWIIPAGLSSYATIKLGQAHPYAVAILPVMEFGGALYMFDVEMQYQQSRSDLIDTSNRALASGIDAEIVDAHLRGVEQRSAAIREAARLGFTTIVTVSIAGAK